MKMFANHRHHAGLTQEAHRALPFISNTDLSNLKAELLGKPNTPNPVALTFGSHFHTATLEPHRYARTEELCDWSLVETLAAEVRRQRYCRDLLFRGQAEQTHTATHAATGVPVKIRPDLLHVSPRIGKVGLVDFKTTSARDYAGFCATIEQYDYDRQAALYADVLGATRFTIIGVQKKAPFAVWQVELFNIPGLFEQGRKKYTRLLRAYAEQSAGRLLAPKSAA
ncbi:PD-(D/E)XK nuclease-like domain-containing protein [Hymenobacter sp. BT770]|uniref:PD-(D/E)XK nuclease-like domain-containing protein n=1 Tax=Hymenobacter sp. BT770 TaxID=2886942 RepID=UPI001D124BD0|nr:PD-(D/E)XK nuclease-like domain-containing protein [Hymenobacter sp. BT770]MCC3152792.1 PD-(D/E)XK nuclease-like domain-containing protein [Hymenobacter sp. BT770]MDO3414867.1 PD-(D/E)XK nuclease-like domain-containing protein [Hymenobacter sp. BT770]